MKENLLVLNNWFDAFAGYNFLSFNEAKFLYEKDKNNKEVLDKIILATMYNVYEYLHDSIYIHFNTADFEFKDIINNAVLLWIELIKNDGLEKYKSFANILQYLDVKLEFKLINETLIHDLQIVDIFRMSKKKMAYFYYEYVNKNYITNDEHILNLFRKFDQLAKVYNINLQSLRPMQFTSLCRMFLYLLVKGDISNNLIVANFEDDVLKAQLYEDIRKLVLNSTRHSLVLQKYLGFDGEALTFNQIAALENCSVTFVNTMYQKELKKIRKYKYNELKKYNDELE